MGRRSQGPPLRDESSPHRRHRGHAGDDEAAWLPEARSGRLSYPPATFESRGTRGRGPPGDRDRDHRRGFHQQQFYGSSPLYHDRRDELAHYPPPPRGIAPAYRDGRDAFGRDWPPPGRGGAPYPHSHPHDYRAAPLLEGEPHYPHHHHLQPHYHHHHLQQQQQHRPRSRGPRPSYPPMEGTRGGDALGRAAAYGDRHGDWPRDDHPYHHSTSRHARREGSEQQAADIYAQPLKAYSQWLELQDGAVPAHEAARQYDEFHDKYHPEALEKRHQAITALAQQNYAAFAADHEQGKLDWDSVTQASLHPLDDGRGAKPPPPPPGGEEAEERTAEQVPEGDAGRGASEEGEAGRGGAKVGQADASEESCCDVVFDHLLDAKQLNATVHREVEPPRDALYIKHIPAQGSREELLALFEQVEGFVELVISEPRRFQDFHRTGWAVYENADACQRAHHKFDGYRLRDYDLQLGLPGGGGAERRRKRVRVAPLVANEEARLEKDADTAAQLVRILDRERAIDSDALLALAGGKLQPQDEHEQEQEEHEQEMVVEEPGDARAAVRARLHRSVEYLRRVHLFCYYCAEQFESQAELRRVCGDLPHRRSTLLIPNGGTPSPAREAVPPEEVSWLAYLDARLEQRLSAPAPELCTAKRAVEQEVDACLEAHVKREDEKKYRCAVPKCTKLFMAPDFVRKHLKLKHPHLVEEATRKAVEEQYFQNYVRDPRRILPSMPEATLSARPEQQQQQRGGGGGAGRAAAGAYSSGAGVMGDAPAGMPALSSHSPRHRDTAASPLYAREPVGYAPAFPRSRGFGGGGGRGGGGRFGGHHRPGYVDLDAPPEDASLGEQRTTIDYGDLDAVPEPPPSITSRLAPASATTLDD